MKYLAVLFLLSLLAISYSSAAQGPGTHSPAKGGGGAQAMTLSHATVKTSPTAPTAKIVGPPPPAPPIHPGDKTRTVQPATQRNLKPTQATNGNR